GRGYHLVRERGQGQGPVTFLVDRSPGDRQGRVEGLQGRSRAEGEQLHRRLGHRPGRAVQASERRTQIRVKKGKYLGRGERVVRSEGRTVSSNIGSVEHRVLPRV